MSSMSQNTAASRPLAVPRASSPVGNAGSGALGTSAPRSWATARLASPVPAHRIPGNVGSVTGWPQKGSASGIDDGTVPLAGGGPQSSLPGPGVSALAAALSASYNNGLTVGTSADVQDQQRNPQTTEVGSMLDTSLKKPRTTSFGSFDGRPRSIQGSTGWYTNPKVTADAEIVNRHLVQRSDGNQGHDTSDAISPATQPPTTTAGTSDQSDDLPSPEIDDDAFSSLRLQGGDTTRHIYKWTDGVRSKDRGRMKRSQSFHLSKPEPEDDVLDIENIKVPGGFRRNYLRRAAASPSPMRTGKDAADAETGKKAQPRLVTNNFIEFLTLYGHFAGEELEEDDEILGPNEYFGSNSDEDEDSDSDREPMEDSALLAPRSRRRRRKARGPRGNNTPMNAALLLMKSFVGTGVLFLPKAYLNGGMALSNAVLLGVSLLSYYCFCLLISTRTRVEASFGDMGGILYGPWLRTLILSSVVISQIGFVAAYIVFTSENLQAFVLAVSKCETFIDIKWLILMQMAVFLPFSLLRDISKLGITALIADAFILVGLLYLYYYDILTIVKQHGIAEIKAINYRDWTLFIGTAIFTFEGVGLIIPIQESMKQPKKFPKVLACVMIIITVVFISMGALSYAAYGPATETVVILNMPQDDKLVNGVQFLYSLAILLSTPLQIFPAIRITENELFTRSGKYNPYIKWQKNVFRFLVVMLCAAIAWIGADDLDKFVSIVGSFACIPLVYIYPPMLHYRAVAKTSMWKLADIMLGIFGFCVMAYTTSLTIVSWSGGHGEPRPPGYCDKIGKPH